MAELELFGEVGEFTTVEMNSLNMVSVYPNPATDQLNIDFNGLETGKVRVWLLDIAGRVMTDDYLEGETYGVYRINTSGLATGLYLLKIESDQGTDSRKIIIR
jgi:hypothetical protein